MSQLLRRPATVVQGVGLESRLDVDILRGLLLQGSGLFALVHKCPFAVQMIDNVQALGLQFIPSLLSILLGLCRQCRLFLQVLICSGHRRFANSRLFILLIGFNLQLIYVETAELCCHFLLPAFPQLQASLLIKNDKSSESMFFRVGLALNLPSGVAHTQDQHKDIG